MAQWLDHLLCTQEALIQFLAPHSLREPLRVIPKTELAVYPEQYQVWLLKYEYTK